MSTILTVSYACTVSLQVAHSHSAMAELQLHCSHLVKSTDENGNTPLHLACGNGFVEVAKLLMKMNGADIGAR